MTETALHWLEHADQRLALCPAAGGSVAAWQWLRAGQAVDIWRPWTPGGPAPAASGHMASFPLVPWSNRIGAGGFSHAGQFHPLRPNSDGEPCPIHGEGWLQPWTVRQSHAGMATMRLTSCRYLDSPYHYRAEQSFVLRPGGMVQSLAVTNLSPVALPYGLGAHPWFTRTPLCSVRAPALAVWLSGADKLPTVRSTAFPAGWNLQQGVSPAQVVIDNGYDGWNGHARLCWPERDLQLTLQATLAAPGAAGRLSVVLYTPENSDVFCFEPVSHPINAAHLPGQPGWLSLQPGQSMALKLVWGLQPHGTTRQDRAGGSACGMATGGISQIRENP